MKLPKVSAVIVAAALAPTVLFPSMASAADQPKPTGVSGPDAASDAVEDSQEAQDRAEIQRILDDKATGRGVREGAQKALAGTAADLRHFLTVELDGLRQEDDRVEAFRLIATGGPAVKKAATEALRGSHADLVKFLKEGQFAARAEDDDRAEVQRILADKDSGTSVREAAQKVVDGTAAELRHFLEVDLENARITDDRVRVVQILSTGGRSVKAAAEKALRVNSPEAIRKFLTEGQFTARAEDDRVEILTLIGGKDVSPAVFEAAQKALGGTPAQLRHFLTVELPNIREQDDRVKLSQIMHVGGPAVRKAANAAMSGSHADVLKFLREGQYTARAEDEAAAAAEAAAKQTTPPVQPGQSQNTGAGHVQPAAQTTQTGQTAQTAAVTGAQATPAVVPAKAAGTTTGTTATGTTAGTTAAVSGQLAATGVDEGLGWEAGGAAAAVAAGAALVAVSRRRRSVEG
ncbi:ALF repeat-containing protein [Kitasatospora sp. NBC_00458]|uniref:ALF repeat-containing protein n=1 Tax=Kitasatospora sp. NBC_00458 TaxID=2903568 RepID=UPI002E170F0B